MDFLSSKGLSINSNYNLWKYAEVLELNKQTVANTRPEFGIEDGRMRMAEHEAKAKRKQISVFNTFEKLSKHPSVFINYLRALASARGMAFTIQQQPEEGAAPQRNKTKKECNVSNIIEA